MATVVGPLRKKHMGDALMDVDEPLDAPGNKGYSGDALEDYESDSEEEKEEVTPIPDEIKKVIEEAAARTLGNAVKRASEIYEATGSLPAAREGSIEASAGDMLGMFVQDLADRRQKANVEKEKAKLRKRKSRANIAARLKDGEGAGGGGAMPA